MHAHTFNYSETIYNQYLKWSGAVELSIKNLNVNARKCNKLLSICATQSSQRHCTLQRDVGM